MLAQCLLFCACYSLMREWFLGVPALSFRGSSLKNKAEQNQKLQGVMDVDEPQQER